MERHISQGSGRKLMGLSANCIIELFNCFSKWSIVSIHMQHVILISWATVLQVPLLFSQKVQHERYLSKALKKTETGF